MALYLTESDVERLLDMPTTLAVVEEAFRQLAAGKAMNVPRVRARSPGAILHTLSAAADYLGLVGLKAYVTNRGGMRSHVCIYDAASGALRAMIEANRLGQLRTGAATGIAIKTLAATDATEIGIFGSGYQAETQFEAAAHVRAITRAVVYSRDADRRQQFADRLSQRLGIRVESAERPEEAVRNLPLVITATSSSTPLFDGNLLSDGALVCAVGSNWLNKAEIDVLTVRRATTVICDSVEACRYEAGDFVEAVKQGAFDWSTAKELATVVAGESDPLPQAGVRLFKSVGLAIEDLAVGAKLIDLARQQGVGRDLAI